MIYLYENHISGGLYITRKKQTDEECRCEMCGDSDFCVLQTNEEEELATCLRDYLNVFDLGGLDLDYLQKIYDKGVKILKEQAKKKRGGVKK